MPIKTECYRCYGCDKFIAVDAEYLEIKRVEIQEHDSTETNPQRITIEEAVVCSNDCLSKILTFKHF